SDEAPLGPAEIRALRGKQSRAALARQIGVTPHTIYRWELPDSAAEARRPRGADLARLRAIARGPRAVNEVTTAMGETLDAAPGAASNVWTDEDLARVLPSLERVLRGDARKGHGELLALLTGGRAVSAAARALACVGVALFELFQRADG